jgi:NAD(P)-dependent dehydrogenase (short-subunit alcohol dehydrogenase family)
MTTWEGRRVLVTGASSGIGAAIARDLAGQGAVVGMCARRAGLLEAVLADCRQTSPSSRAWNVDLSRLDDLESFVARVEDELGGIDVLVNNAGVTLHGVAAETATATLEDQLRINFLSPVRLTQAALPGMQQQADPRVIVISSMAARTSTPGEAAYSSAKSALSSFFEAWAGELAGGPVRFHLVYPALIEVANDADGDDALAVSSNGATQIPAPVCARAIRRGVEAGDFEIYVPQTMQGWVADRARDVAGAVSFMGSLYQEGKLPS